MSNLVNKQSQKIKKLILSNTAKNTYILSFSDITLVFLAAVTTALIARSLSPAEFGTFISLWTFLTLIAALLDLGIGAGIVRFVAESQSLTEQNKYIGPGLLFLFIIGMLQFLGIFLGVNIVQSILFPQISTMLIIIAALGSWLLLIGKFVNDVLRAKQEFLRSGVATIGFALLRLILIVILLLQNKLSLFRSMLVMGLSPIIYAALGFFYLHLQWKYINWDWSIIKKLIGFSGWLGVNQVISTISGRIDVLLLNRLAGALSAGIYGTASLMARVFVVITASISAVFAPRLIQLQEKSQRQAFIKKIILVILIGWLFIVAVGLISKPLINLIFGFKYLAALAPFYILLIAMAGLMGTIPVTLLIIYIIKKPHIIAGLSIIQLIIVFIGNLALIPRLGILAPPLLLASTQLLTITVGSYYAYQWWKN